MKRIFLLLLLVSSASAQVGSDVISQPATRANSSTNEAGIGGLNFTNRSGTSYTVNELATQLRNLRSDVDQVLPILTAFNESFSGSSVNSTQSIGGAISGILSGALKHNSADDGASSLRSSNILAVLQGLLGTNAAASSPISANTLRDLSTLQTQLQPVATTLQTLNVTGSLTNSPGTPQRNPILTPTGR
jgi:hypothetical protein